MRKPVLRLLFFSQDLGVFCFIWGSGVFVENLGFFDSGQILQMYVVLLYFPFKNGSAYFAAGMVAAKGLVERK